MRFIVILSSFALSTAACSSKKEPAPDTAAVPAADTAPAAAPDTAPAAAPDTAPAVPPDAAPAPDAAPTADAAAASDNQALVDAFFASGDASESQKDIALFVPEDKTVYFTQSWHEEGTGAGLALVSRASGGKEESLEIFTPAADEKEAAAAVVKARKTLLDKLRGKRVVALEAIGWPTEKRDDDMGPPLATLSLPGFSETFHWKRGKLEVKDAAGKVLATVDAKKDADPPHKPEPSAVYAKAGVRTLLLLVTFDPGDQYGEYNVYNATYVIELP